MSNEIKTWQERYRTRDHSEQSCVAESYKNIEIAELRAKVESLAADAERYKAMKENDFTSEYSDYISDCLNDRERIDLDNTIDAAMAKEKA